MGILDVDSVSVRFGGVQALREVSLELNKSEILGLIGPNGAGKTTLFEVITGFQSPDQGSVYLEGDSISGLDPYEVNRRGLGRTFQMMELFLDMTALENVIVGGLIDTNDLVAAERRAEEMLELVGLTAKRQAPADTLSTGQRKRLEMARAMASHPRVLLLDEVFGGVDLAACESLSNVIRQLHRETGTSVFVIDHNLELLLGLVDRVVALAAGKVIAAGSPKEVANDPAVVEAYVK